VGTGYAAPEPATQPVGLAGRSRVGSWMHYLETFSYNDLGHCMSIAMQWMVAFAPIKVAIWRISEESALVS